MRPLPMFGLPADARRRPWILTALWAPLVLLTLILVLVILAQRWRSARKRRGSSDAGGQGCMGSPDAGGWNPARQCQERWVQPPPSMSPTSDLHFPQVHPRRSADLRLTRQ